MIIASTPSSTAVQRDDATCVRGCTKNFRLRVDAVAVLIRERLCDRDGFEQADECDRGSSLEEAEHSALDSKPPRHRQWREARLDRADDPDASCLLEVRHPHQRDAEHRHCDGPQAGDGFQ